MSSIRSVGNPDRHIKAWETDGTAGSVFSPVGRGQKLSHYSGQIEPPVSLPRGATAGSVEEVMAEEC